LSEISGDAYEGWGMPVTGTKRMRFVDKSLRTVLLMVLLLLAAWFCIGQAVTFAWLLAFPELSELNSCASISILGIGVMIFCAIRLVKKTKG